MYQLSDGILKLNGNVQIPKYYSKVVCDPVERSSIAFYGVNPHGWDGIDRKETGCLRNKMSLDKGLVHCVSLDSLRNSEVSKGWNLPSLALTCNPSTEGKFLNLYLVNWK